MKELVATVRDMFASWYKADRIRVSPTTGRLLHLQQGDRFVFRSEAYCVTERNATANGARVSIEYYLNSLAKRCCLKVSQGENRAAVRGQLIDASGVREVFEDEITVL